MLNTLFRGLQVAIADDDPDTLDLLKRTLRVLGHQVIFTASTGRALVDLAHRHEPELVIADIRMPDVDGLEAAKLLNARRPTPVILISGFGDQELIAKAQQSQVLGFLVKPISQEELDPAILQVMRRFREFQSLQREASDLEQAHIDRQLIDQAKSIVMRHLELTEDEAFSRLQKLATDRCIKLVEVAESIVTAARAFGT